MFAETFHFQPSELGAMTASDILFWHARLNETARRRSTG